LFILYVNDLPLYLHETISELYADDTTIHTSNESVHVINNKLQNDLVQVKKWCKNNDMALNAKKTKTMLMGPPANYLYFIVNYNSTLMTSV